MDESRRSVGLDGGLTSFGDALSSDLGTGCDQRCESMAVEQHFGEPEFEDGRDARCKQEQLELEPRIRGKRIGYFISSLLKSYDESPETTDEVLNSSEEGPSLKKRMSDEDTIDVSSGVRGESRQSVDGYGWMGDDFDMLDSFSEESDDSQDFGLSLSTYSKLSDSFLLAEGVDDETFDAAKSESGLTAQTGLKAPALSEAEEGVMNDRRGRFCSKGFDWSEFVSERKRRLTMSWKVHRMRLQMSVLKLQKHQMQYYWEIIREIAVIESEIEAATRDWKRRKDKEKYFAKLTQRESLIAARRKALSEHQLKRESGGGGDAQAGSKSSQKDGAKHLSEEDLADTGDSNGSKAGGNGVKKKPLLIIKKDGKEVRRKSAYSTNNSNVSSVQNKTLTSIGTCTFNGCSERVLPLTNFCYCHILYDQNQLFFSACTYVSPETGQHCIYPIVKYQNPPYCANHADLQLKEKPASKKSKRRESPGKDEDPDEDYEEEKEELVGTAANYPEEAEIPAE